MYNSDDYELHDVSNFEIIGDYTLRLMFDDGAEQIINFESVLYGPLFGPLRKLEIFNQVKLDKSIGTLVWPTGADIDPTVLYNWPHHVESIIERRRKKIPVSA